MAATSILGVLGAAWHITLISTTGGGWGAFRMSGAELLPVAITFLSIATHAFWYTWLFNLTGSALHRQMSQQTCPCLWTLAGIWSSAVGPRRRSILHFFTLDRPGAAVFRVQSYAVDIIGITAAGLRMTGISPADPSLYEIYGADVLAPCNGTVVQTIDGIPDNPVPQMNRDVLTGNSVEIGQKIAEVGNLGNFGEPHLHVHVQEIAPRDRPKSGEPLWFTIEGSFFVRNDRFMGRS